MVDDISRFPFPLSPFLSPVSRHPFPVSRFPFPVTRFPFPASRLTYPPLPCTPPPPPAFWTSPRLRPTRAPRPLPPPHRHQTAGVHAVSGLVFPRRLRLGPAQRL